MADGVGFVGDFTPGLGAPGEGVRQGHGGMVVDQHLIGVGSAMTDGGDGRAGQGIHQGGLADAGAPKEADHQRAFRHGLQLADQFERIIEQPFLFLTGQGQKGSMMEQGLDPLEIGLQFLGGTQWLLASLKLSWLPGQAV